MDVLDERAINVFTDGSSYSHPRRGGVGIRIITVGVDGHEIVHEEQPQGFQGLQISRWSFRHASKLCDTSQAAPVTSIHVTSRRSSFTRTRATSLRATFPPYTLDKPMAGRPVMAIRLLMRSSGRNWCVRLLVSADARSSSG